MGQALGWRVDATREVVFVVPGQARRSHAALVPLVEGAGVPLERLEPLQREQEPQARIVELVAHADVANTLGVLLHSTPELGLLGERPGACFLSWHGGAVEGADLDSDSAGLELRQPIP